ncbi:hypothetical protein JTE90_022276 [Oedothorax gibbosus]|uniref:Uncharacterized protein n=1 Tax=Oedothorax gibbosus TaxID=931172 RepID=A0AAV6VVJ9_9ARAC|nr:hypothetical protein JTE90_022276 [Oedothorax gibbosus]
MPDIHPPKHSNLSNKKPHLRRPCFASGSFPDWIPFCRHTSSQGCSGQTNLQKQMTPRPPPFPPLSTPAYSVLLRGRDACAVIYCLSGD